MRPGDQFTVTIERPVAGGRMLARQEGAVVLVSGALPGECVEARVSRVRKGTAWAEVTRVIEVSPFRVGEPNPCGGCVLAHAEYGHQRAIKQQIVVDTFARLARLAVPPPEVVGAPAEGYRMRARLHVRDDRIGFFVEGTHRLCDPASTGQLLPETLAVLREVAAVLSREAPDRVRTIDLAENRAATERALHLELTPAADPSGISAVAGVDGLTALSWSHEGSTRGRTIVGDGRVTDRFVIAGGRWSLSRGTRAFFQGNRFLLDPLVADVQARLAPGAVTDLYAGVGLFALAAVAVGHAPVTAVEGDPVSAADLRLNAADWRGLLQARHDTVEAFLRNRRLIVPQTVILDPPRTGLSRAALAGLIAMKAPRLVYVSCDVPTLARDARALDEAGYALSALRAFDLFPKTAHVETVGTFDLRR